VRILLFTGKGGVGKTTIAASTAAKAAASGLRTVICSTDPAHSLADVFDHELGDQPTEIAPQLFGQQLDARLRLEETWGDVRSYLTAVLDWAGADAVEAEELAVIPGLDEVFALADIKAHATSGKYDLVVVDCAPTAETLRLLSLPDVLGWYMDRVFPATRNVHKAVRPLLSRMISMPLASDNVFAAMRRFYDRLDGVRDLLTDGAITSARLVVTPERMVIAEARRTYTYLSLFGYHVDAVVANRLLPERIEDAFFREWQARQGDHLTTITEAFAPLPILTAELAPEEPIGIDRLLAVAAGVYGDHAADERLATVEPWRIDTRGAVLVLSLHLPFAEKSDVDLGRTADELFLAVGPHRRSIVLPDSLARREVDGAVMRGDRLEISFVEPTSAKVVR
jgi:arsenite-transporting ATPase